MKRCSLEITDSQAVLKYMELLPAEKAKMLDDPLRRPKPYGYTYETVCAAATELFSIDAAYEDNDPDDRVFFEDYDQTDSVHEDTDLDGLAVGPHQRAGWSGDQQPQDQQRVIIKSSKPCFDFQAGKCWRGADCKFSHEQSEPASPADDEPQENVIQFVMEYACITDCTREQALGALKATSDGELVDDYGYPIYDEAEAMRYLEAQAEFIEAGLDEPSVVRQQTAEEEPSVARQQTLAEVPRGSSAPPWVTSR